MNRPADDRENGPDDLAALEASLARRERMTPEPALRRHVLAAIEHELDQAARGAAPGRSWWGWAAVAAAVLLWLNFSMSVTQQPDWRAAPLGGDEFARAMQRVRDLAPELSAADAARHAALLLARTRAQAPAYRAPTYEHYFRRDAGSWDSY